MHPPSMIALRHLLVNDAAAGGHPLHITSADHAVVAHAVAVGYGSGQHVRDRLDSPVRMPRESGQIVLRNIVAEIVEEEEGIEVFCVSKTECSPKMHARTLESRLRFDKPLNRSDRHSALQSEFYTAVIATYQRQGEANRQIQQKRRRSTLVEK